LAGEPVAAPSGTLYERARRLVHRPVDGLLERRMWRDDVALVRRASKVVTNSVFNQSRIREVYGVEAVVCPPGVEVPPAVPFSRRLSHVLSVGELELRKGHDLVISALGLLPASTRPALRVIANGGNPAVGAELERLAAACGVELKIRTFPSQAELAQEYAEATLFLTGARQEPLGLAPLEAMAAGLPVVGVAEGGLLETVRDSLTGYLVERDARAFSSRVAELLSRPVLREEMGAAARSHVEAEWTWPRRARALEVELESLMSAQDHAI
jgi:glycosyltransferase involved in cell wall biosynthesis